MDGLESISMTCDGIKYKDIYNSLAYAVCNESMNDSSLYDALMNCFKNKLSVNYHEGGDASHPGEYTREVNITSNIVLDKIADATIYNDLKQFNNTISVDVDDSTKYNKNPLNFNSTLKYIFNMIYYLNNRMNISRYININSYSYPLTAFSYSKNNTLKDEFSDMNISSDVLTTDNVNDCLNYIYNQIFADTVNTGSLKDDSKTKISYHINTNGERTCTVEVTNTDAKNLKIYYREDTPATATTPKRTGEWIYSGNTGTSYLYEYKYHGNSNAELLVYFKITSDNYLTVGANNTIYADFMYTAEYSTHDDSPYIGLNRTQYATLWNDSGYKWIGLNYVYYKYNYYWKDSKKPEYCWCQPAYWHALIVPESCKCTVYNN